MNGVRIESPATRCASTARRGDRSAKESPVTRHANLMPSSPRRGLTFVEVIIAASILAIAALASLELLASSDASNLFARRQALAAIEAERTLAVVSDLVKDGKPIPDSATLSAGLVGEALVGCTIRVTGTQTLVTFELPGEIAGGATRQVQLLVNNLVAEVEGPDGDVVVTLERPVPMSTGGAG